MLQGLADKTISKVTLFKKSLLTPGRLRRCLGQFVPDDFPRLLDKTSPVCYDCLTCGVITLLSKNRRREDGRDCFEKG